MTQIYLLHVVLIEIYTFHEIRDLKTSIAFITRFQSRSIEIEMHSAKFLLLLIGVGKCRG